MPPDVVSVFALGERTGTLPRLLVDVAQLHAGEATSRLKKLSGVLVPVIILVSGALVGSFAVAMMMTIQSVNQIYGG
jgi:type II secretory pathway component PulF